MVWFATLAAASSRFLWCDGKCDGKQGVSRQFWRASPHVMGDEEESDGLREPVKRGAWLAASLVLATAQASPSSFTAPELRAPEPGTAANPDLAGAEQARMTCLRFVHVRLGVETAPISIETRPVPAQVGQWWVGGNVKGPEGPLLFACHLRQGARWELLDFALWAASPPA